ncbi:MAG: hypothetical protein B7733_13015 [Myxococcales bacterium FL481]|nr:MAG: hypothetical protein B7733_13015 [Myxococcales bacterium FL481]
MTENPPGAQAPVYMGDKDSSSGHLEPLIQTDGTITFRDRGTSSTTVQTANSISTSGKNVLSCIWANNGGGGSDYQIKIKLNGGSADTYTTGLTGSGANWDRVAIGRLMDSSPAGAFSGKIHGIIWGNDDDSFADHDQVWNSGTVLDVNTETFGANVVTRWPLDGTSGNTVTGTDTEIDDAIGSADLDTVGGSPEYVDDEVLFPTAQGNGFDVVLTATNETTGNYTVKAGTLSSETTRTIQSVRRISATQVRIRLANGERILSGQSVLVSDTAQGVTDEAATNSSEQATNKIVDRGLAINFTTLNEADVGLFVTGEFQYKGSNHPQSATYTPGSGEEQYRFVAAMLNPPAGQDETHPFHEDSGTYDAGDAFTLGTSLTEDDVLVFAVSYPELDTHATSTAFSLGDVVKEAGNFFRCTTAGTTSGTKPSFTTETVNDGTAVWTREVGPNNSLVQKCTLLAYVGSTLKSQETFRCAWNDSATKTYYTTADMNTGLLPGDAAVAGQDDLADAEANTRYPWFELGYVDGAHDDHQPQQQMGVLYGRDLCGRAALAVQVAMSDTSYTDTLVEYLVQRGIDYIGIREAGGYWRGLEGFSNGRIILPLFAAAVLEITTTAMPILRVPKSGSESEDDWRGIAEFAEQMRYIDTATFDADIQGGYDYFDGNAGTWVNPANAPSTYSDSPSNAYFPATIRDTWEHVPEWIPRGWDPTGTGSATTSGPRWDAGSTYRLCCTAVNWGLLEYMIYAFNLEAESGVDAFLDYMARYYLIEGADSSQYKATFKTLRDTHLSTHQPTYAIASASLVGSTLTLTFNRYTTWSAANDGAFTVDSGSLGAWSQTGPRTWQSTVTGGPPTTVSYASASGDAVDAENNALADQTNVAIDSTAPTLSSPTATATGDSTGTGSVSTDEGNGTLYFVVTDSATSPSAAQVKDRTDHTGDPAQDADDQAVSGTGVQNISGGFTGLEAGTTYYAHYMHEDAAANQSSVSTSAGFTTTGGDSGSGWFNSAAITAFMIQRARRKRADDDRSESKLI